MTKRLRVFHEFCALSPEAQTVAADVIRWLLRTRVETRAQAMASLDALAAVPVRRRRALRHRARGRDSTTALER
jgi:hypothetical protein